ncbi:MAG: ATP-binding protein [Candidatus Brocadiia bacterium]
MITETSTSNPLLRTRKNVVVVMRLIVFTVIYLIAFQEHNPKNLSWFIWFIMGIFLVSEVVYMFEHKTHFFIQRILGWIFLFDAVLITMLIYLLSVKTIELYIAYFAVIAIATMSKSVATSFVVAILVSAFYLFMPMYEGKLVFTEFITRPLFFFSVSMFSGYLSEEIYRQQKKKVEFENRFNLLENQLRQAQKMEVFGQLAGGIAHDFNNCIGVILGSSELALEDTQHDHKAFEPLKIIHRQAEHGRNLIRRLLSIGRQQQLHPKSINLNELVAETNKYMVRLLPENINLKIAPAANLRPAQADPTAIEQILMNLYLNARDAMAKGGDLTVTTSNIFVDQDFAAHHPPLKTGHYVILQVSDTGQGMDEKVRRHLFEPFFTTKPDGKGTGLGLVVVYNLVIQHQGYIDVQSTPAPDKPTADSPASGTTFRIYLPISLESAQPAIAAKPESFKGGTETILLADDDAALSELLATILKTTGYTVLSVPDGDQALTIFDANKDKISLAVLDIGLPKKDGIEVFKTIRRINPEVKVLFTSGYLEGGIQSDYIKQQELDFIQKPFSITSLKSKIRTILDLKPIAIDDKNSSTEKMLQDKEVGV